MYESKLCQQTSCTQAAIVSLRTESYWLEHFCCRSYQLLERIGQRSSPEPGTLEQALFADECARRTIDICLNADCLNNLERARLLDILLWCGDISAAFHPLQTQDKPALRLPYEKPELRASHAKAALSD